MGLVALERPPYDLLTVWFIKYNTGLESVFVIQLLLNRSSSTRLYCQFNEARSSLNIHHLSLVSRKTILQPQTQPSWSIRTPQSGVISTKPQRKRKTVAFTSQWNRMWVPPHPHWNKSNYQSSLSFGARSLRKTLTLQSLRASPVEMWDLGDLTAGGHVEGGGDKTQHWQAEAFQI